MNRGPAALADQAAYLSPLQVDAVLLFRALDRRENGTAAILDHGS